MHINLIAEDIDEKEYLLNKLKTDNLNIEIKNDDELNFLLEVLAKYIIEEKEIKIIDKILSREYFYFTKSEKKMIEDKCIQILKSENIKENSKKELLKLLLLEYINENQELNIKGFITFRIKSYRKICFRKRI